MAGAVRINRYLAAAGLGTRREAEGLLRAGRVTVNGAVCAEPATMLGPGDEVLLDGRPLPAGRTGVVLHRTVGGGLEIVHPGVLHPVLPRREGSGLELLLADAGLAQRLADPRHPLAERIARDGVRTRLGSVSLGDLAPGAWRPVAPRELEALRRGARLPPRAG